MGQPNQSESAAADNACDFPQLDGYKIEALVGSGAMGRVYRALHIEMNRYVAVKVLSHSSRTSSERFIRESRVLHEVAHDNIVRIFASGQLADGRQYIVMELLEGKTLADVLSTGRISTAELLPILKQVCAGLIQAHAKNVIHRDLKPSNVMLLGEHPFVVKLVDFGLAAMPESSKQQALTATGELLGTPKYMSPEQCLGAAVDARSDIYSLGCLTFEALTGASPFSGGSALELMSRHVNDSVKLPGYLPVRWRQLVSKATAKDPAQRFQSVEEMLAQLQSMPTSARATGRPKTAMVALISIVTLGILCMAVLPEIRGKQSAVSTELKERCRYECSLSQKLIYEALSRDRPDSLRAALRHAEAATKLCPDSAEAWFMRARCNNMLRNHAEALADLNRAIELEPRAPLSYLERGQCFVALGKLDLAQLDLQTARRYMQNSVRISPAADLKLSMHRLQGNIHLARGVYDLAVREFSEVLKISLDAFTLANRSEAYAALGQGDKSIADLDALILANQTHVDRVGTGQKALGEAYYLRAERYKTLNRSDKAAMDFDKARQLGVEKLGGQ